MSHYSEYYDYAYLPPRPEYKPESWQQVLKDLDKGKAGLNVGLLYDVIKILITNEIVTEKLPYTHL